MGENFFIDSRKQRNHERIESCTAEKMISPTKFLNLHWGMTQRIIRRLNDEMVES